MLLEGDKTVWAQGEGSVCVLGEGTQMTKDDVWQARVAGRCSQP